MKRLLSAVAIAALATGLLVVPATAADFDSTVHLTKDATPGAQNSGVYDAVALGSRLVYIYESTALGTEIWVSDGTQAGSHLLKDIVPGAASSDPYDLTLFKGRVYFRAHNAAYGDELWSTDGSAAGTRVYRDLEPGPVGSSSGEDQIVPVGGTLYFGARLTSGTNAGAQVWKTDGQPAHTTAVHVIRATNGTTGISRMTRWGNRLAFAAIDDAGTEPWVTDGITTLAIKDVNPGPGGSNPANFAVLGTKLFFTATATGSSGNTEVWWTAPPVNNLISAFPLSPSVNIFFPNMLVTNGSTLYFVADSGAAGDELWKTDGTNAGTVLAKDINPSPGIGSFIGEGTVFGGSMYFSAQDGPNNAELWKANPSGVTKVKEINAADGSFPNDFLAIGSQLYFSARGAGIGFELFVTDGSTAGTKLVKDLAPGPDDSYADPLAVVGSTLFMSAQTPTTADELWVYSTKSSTTKGYPKAKYSKKVAKKKRIYVTIKVRATGTVPTGKVYLRQGTKVVGVGVLKNGNASIRITKSWRKGIHKVRAYYTGSVYARTSTSALIRIKVK